MSGGSPTEVAAAGAYVRPRARLSSLVVHDERCRTLLAFSRMGQDLLRGFVAHDISTRQRALRGRGEGGSRRSVDHDRFAGRFFGA